MKNLFICIAIIILFHNYLFAQKSDSLNLVYNNQTIYRYGGSFLKGNEKLNFKGNLTCPIWAKFLTKRQKVIEPKV